MFCPWLQREARHGHLICTLCRLSRCVSTEALFVKQVMPSQELVAIGAANMIGSFFQAYPITGSFSRCAVNSACGVKTLASGKIRIQTRRDVVLVLDSVVCKQTNLDIDLHF